MSGATERSFAILEYLASCPDGATLAEIASKLNQIRSGCHRALGELISLGYVRQFPDPGAYALTTKLVSSALRYLSRSGVVDIAQPVIKGLSHTTEELVELAVVDGERLNIGAKAQGAKSGLIYDSDSGIDLRLSCSAAGQAWLMTLPEDIAIQYVSRQGIGIPEDYGPAAPTSVRALLSTLREHCKRRFSIIQDTYALGMSALAAPIQRTGMLATGAIVISGPSSRLTLKRMQAFGPALLAAADELAAIGNASPLLKSSNVGTWGNVSETLAGRGRSTSLVRYRKSRRTEKAAAPRWNSETVFGQPRTSDSDLLPMLINESVPRRAARIEKYVTFDGDPLR